MSRIGIYGGAFNPPHAGHVLAAKETIRRLSLDRLLVIPTYLSPHKPVPNGTPDPALRLELTRLAFTGVEKAEVSELEILREGVSYTVDTLRTLRERFPGDELILLMGTDMLLSFAGWRCPEEIAAMATLAVMHRQSEPETLRARVRETAGALRQTLGARVEFVENECLELSSTELRRMLALGAWDYGLPLPVAERIRAEGLYGSADERRGLPFEALKEISLALHDPARCAHVCGTSELSRELALRWGEDPEDAQRAGILHDITKALSPQAQLALCEHYGLELTAFERGHPKLLHAKSGAAAARVIFGERERVCSAIEWHTTGRAGMNCLEKILYIADYAEPTRSFDGVEELRRLSREDLDAAVLEGLRITMDYVRGKGQPVDPNSLAAQRSILEQRGEAL